MGNSFSPISKNHKNVKNEEIRISFFFANGTSESAERRERERESTLFNQICLKNFLKIISDGKKLLKKIRI